MSVNAEHKAVKQLQARNQLSLIPRGSSQSVLERFLFIQYCIAI